MNTDRRGYPLGEEGNPKKDAGLFPPQLFTCRTVVHNPPDNPQEVRHHQQVESSVSGSPCPPTREGVPLWGKSGFRAEATLVVGSLGSGLRRSCFCLRSSGSGMMMLHLRQASILYVGSQAGAFIFSPFVCCLSCCAWLTAAPRSAAEGRVSQGIG